MIYEYYLCNSFLVFLVLVCVLKNLNIEIFLISFINYVNYKNYYYFILIKTDVK